MFVKNEVLFSIIHTLFLSKCVEETIQEEIPTLEFENKEAFLDFNIKINETLVNLAEFENFNGGEFVTTISQDLGVLILFFIEEENLNIVQKKFWISY